MAKNLVQMSVNGVLYDIRDQRMTTKLDYIHTSLTQALEHKQDLATAVVTDNDSVNWIGRLTSGSTSAVTRYKDDYIDTITGPADTHIHSLWFSMGPISYDPADKDNKELEQQRAWSKSFGVEFQELTKRPRILGLDAEDRKAEVNIYGKSLHTEYIDSPLGINYIHPDKVEAIEHNIIGLPQGIPELDCLQWLYYGKRDNETNTTPLLENINIIGNASAITNIALWDFFQKEDNNYYRVLSEERIANKQVNKEQKPSNAYKIVTLDENGIIPDIFLGELKSNPLNIGNVQLIDDNSQFIIKNDNVTGDNFVIAIQPSDIDTDTTKLTQTTINTKDIMVNNITVSDTITTNTLNVNEDAAVTGKVSAGSAEITSISASNIQITNKADIQTLDVKGDATVTGTLSATYLDAALDLSARNATFSKDIQAKNATITAKTTTNTLEVKDSATIANLIADTAVSSTNAVGYDDTGKLIPITYSDATQSSAGLMSAADKLKLDGINSELEEIDSAKNDKITVSADYTSEITGEVCFTLLDPVTNPTYAVNRKFSQVWEYIKSKISSVLGLTEDTYSGKADTAGTADTAVIADKSNSVDWEKADKYKQKYSYDGLGVYITGAHSYGSVVVLGGRFTADISYNSITYFIDVLFEAKNNNLYAKVLSNNSPLSICQVTDENGLNTFYLMNKNEIGLYTVNVLHYSDFILSENIKLSANVSNDYFKPFTVINPIEEPPTESDSYSLKAEVSQNENYSYQQLTQYSPKTIEVGTDVIRVEITDFGGATQLTLLPGETKEYSGNTYSFIDGVVTSQYSWYNQGMKTYKLVYKELTYTWEYMSTQTVEQATKAIGDGNGNNIVNTYMPKAGGTFSGAITSPNFRIPVGQPKNVKNGDIWIG